MLTEPISEYKKIPKHHKDDNVIPSMSEIPSLITSMRHPRRRAVSIGPQSEADAYETLAYRAKRRRESMSAGYVGSVSPMADHTKEISLEDASPPSSPTNASKLDAYEHMMGTGSNLMTVVPNEDGSPTYVMKHQEQVLGDGTLQDRDEKEMFSKLEKPRVRYDVEVVTKLIVYSGKWQMLWLLERYTNDGHCQESHGLRLKGIRYSSTW